MFVWLNWMLSTRNNLHPRISGLQIYLFICLSGKIYVLRSSLLRLSGNKWDLDGMEKDFLILKTTKAVKED